jgi:hypothetical protein
VLPGILLFSEGEPHELKKKPPGEGRLVSSFMGTALFFAVSFHKLVNPAGGIHKVGLACKERMRFVGNFQLVKRIIFPVFPFNGFLCLHGRPRDKFVIAGHISEYH